jgi:hypothetical protein
MTPFDINPDNDAGHAIDQDDLIAFHLHDLPSSQERAVHRVLRTNPALQAESLAIASTLRAFPKHEPALPLDPAGLDRHWQTLRNSLPVHIPPASAPLSLFSRWAIPAFAVSALAAAAIVLTLHHSSHTTTSTLATNPSPSSIHGPTVPSKSPAELASSTSPSTPFSAHDSLIAHRPSLLHASSQPRPSASVSPTPLPDPPATSTPTPRAITPSPSATAAASTTLATTHQPQSLSTPASVSPTFTPIIETRGHPRTHHPHTTDITGALFGDFTPSESFTSTTSTGASTVTIPYSQAASPSLGVLASFHQQLRPWLGYRITASHAAPSFEYNYAPTPGSGGGIVVPQNVFELSATYVVRGPRYHRIQTSAEAGAGVLDFHPSNPIAALGVSDSLRSTAVLGVSAELALTKHFAVHAGYRAMLYKTPPAYLTSGFTVPASGNLTFSNEPVLGLTYRFHQAVE